MEIKRQIRATPQVGYAPYKQVHAHSTGNSSSTVQNEADNQTNNKPVAFFTHVVGNGQIIQIAEVGRGAYDVGGDWNYETYAAVELIESHSNRAEFDRDYRLYVDLLRQLSKDANLPCTLDSKDLSGIKSHMFCTYNQPGNGSDHIDPYPYLNKWGVTVDQFERDLANGFENESNGSNNVTPNKPKQGRVSTMQCIYNRPQTNGKPDNNSNTFGVFFCNGVNTKYLSHPDEIYIIKELYRKNNGHDIPEYTEKDWPKKAPWYKRLESVFPFVK